MPTSPSSTGRPAARNGEVATRDYVRSELRALLNELEEQRREEGPEEAG